MKKDNEDLFTIINNKIDEYKKMFDGLNEQEKELLLYRKIIEIQHSTSKEEIDKEYLILAIKEASGLEIGFFKPLFLYLSSREATKATEQYKILKNIYNNVLDNYRILANELHISSALELSHLFTYMLWNGYYFATKSHYYNMKNRTNIANFTFLDVIKGSGVCLNYSEYLQDYLLTCGKEASILLCEVPKDKSIQRDYKPQIEQNYAKNKNELLKLSILAMLANKLLKIDGNNAIALIKENDKMFAYDPTNLLVLNILNKDVGEIINGKGNFKLLPMFTLIEELLKANYSRAFNRKEIIFSFENTMEHIMNNIPLLDDAYDNVHNELQSLLDNYELLKTKAKKK